MSMDAIALLKEVSSAYHRVKTLAVEAAILTESGDENNRHQNEQRVRCFYAQPNLIRYEPCGKDGVLQVVDGSHVHTKVMGQQPGGPQFNSVPVAEMHWLPHFFRADLPIGGGNGAFLYQGIDERVA